MDDRAARTLEKWQGSVRSAHACHQVDVDADAPAFLVIAGAEPGGVIHEHVDAAERGSRVLYVFRHGRFVGEIADCRVYLATFRLQLAFGSLQGLGATCADRDVRSAIGEAERNRAADAAARASYKDVLSREGEVHGCVIHRESALPGAGKGRGAARRTSRAAGTSPCHISSA